MKWCYLKWFAASTFGTNMKPGGRQILQETQLILPCNFVQSNMNRAFWHMNELKTDKGEKGKGILTIEKKCNNLII